MKFLNADVSMHPHLATEVLKIVDLGEKLDVGKKNVVSLHSLLGAVFLSGPKLFF